MSVVLAACTGPPRATEQVVHSVPKLRSSWIDSQAPVCGEIRGRILLQQIEKPLVGAVAIVQGTEVSARTDASGVFRLRLDSTHPLPAILRVRGLGIQPVLIELPYGRQAYLIEITGRSGGFHSDDHTVVTVRRPSECAPAT